MPYTPPAGDDVLLECGGAYTPPAGDDVILDCDKGGVEVSLQVEGSDTAFDLMFAAVQPPDYQVIAEGGTTATDSQAATLAVAASVAEGSATAVDACNRGLVFAASVAEGSATANDLCNASIDAFVPQYEDIYPIADVTVGAWTPSVPGAEHWDMVDEPPPANFTDYLRSPPNPTTEPEELRFAPLPDYQGNDRFFSVEIALEAINFDTVFDFELRESATVLDSWSEPVTVAEGEVVRTHEFDEAVIALITNRADVRIHFVAHA